MNGSSVSALRALGVLAVLLVVLAVVAWLGQRRLIYFPFGVPDQPASAVFADGADVALMTEDGLRLTAWWAPATGSPRGATVLIAPGNAGSRALRVPLARALAAAGFDVLLMEYRGYGGNPGSPTEDGLAADARAAYRHLVADRGVDPRRLVLFGESLGGAVLTRLATERPIGGLVLRSPFSSLAEVGAHAYPILPVRLLLRDRYPLQEQIRTLRVPVAVIAGDADDVVPVAQSRAVAAAAAASYVELPGLGHNDAALVSGPALVEAAVWVSRS